MEEFIIIEGYKSDKVYEHNFLDYQVNALSKLDCFSAELFIRHHPDKKGLREYAINYFLGMFNNVIAHHIKDGKTIKFTAEAKAIKKAKKKLNQAMYEIALLPHYDELVNELKLRSKEMGEHADSLASLGVNDSILDHLVILLWNGTGTPEHEHIVYDTGLMAQIFMIITGSTDIENCRRAYNRYMETDQFKHTVKNLRTELTTNS